MASDPFARVVPSLKLRSSVLTDGQMTCTFSDSCQLIIMKSITIFPEISRVILFLEGRHVLKI